MFKEVPKIIYLVQLVSKTILYISSNVRDILGLKPSKFYSDGLEVFKSICQEDEDFVLYPERESSSLASSGLYSGEIILRGADRQYQLFEHKALILESNPKGLPLVLVGSLSIKKQKEQLHYGCSAQLHGKYEWTETPPSKLASLTSLKNVLKNMSIEERGHTQRLQLLFDNTIVTAISNRQRQVIKYLAKGYSAKCIADKMAISESTVIDHKKKLLTLFNAKNTVEMVAKASKLFWI